MTAILGTVVATLLSLLILFVLGRLGVWTVRRTGLDAVVQRNGGIQLTVDGDGVYREGQWSRRRTLWKRLRWWRKNDSGGDGGLAGERRRLMERCDD